MFVFINFVVRQKLSTDVWNFWPVLVQESTKSRLFSAKGRLFGRKVDFPSKKVALPSTSRPGRKNEIIYLKNVEWVQIFSLFPNFLINYGLALNRPKSSLWTVESPVDTLRKKVTNRPVVIQANLLRWFTLIFINIFIIIFLCMCKWHTCICFFKY
jgi:hypothetical protein